MLEILGHEGMHGTYANHDVDEIAASMSMKGPSKGWSQSIGANIGINAQGIIAASTNQYYIDREKGDLRDGDPILLIFSSIEITYALLKDGAKYKNV